MTLNWEIQKVSKTIKYFNLSERFNVKCPDPGCGRRVVNCERTETRSKVRFLEIGRRVQGGRNSKVSIDLSNLDILSCILQLRKILLVNSVRLGSKLEMIIFVLQKGSNAFIKIL